MYAVSFVAGLNGLLLVPSPVNAFTSGNGWDLFLQVLCVTFSTLYPAFHEAL